MEGARHQPGPMRKIQLHWQILIALALAFLAGTVTGQSTGAFSAWMLRFYEVIGGLFLNALKMLIVPLIVSSLITGIGKIGAENGLGRLGMKTLLYYVTTTFVAILIGLAVVNLLAPGIIDGQPAKEAIGLGEDAGTIEAGLESRKESGLSDFFLRMVPANIVAAAAEGRMLGLIFFSLLFGYFMTRIKGRGAEILSGFWQGVFDLMMLLTEWIMRFAPIGVFGLVAKVAASTGLDAVRPLALFVITVLTGLAIHFGVVLPLLLRFIGGVRPSDHYRGMAPALLAAFSTSSSSATIPITLDCLEKRAGISNRTASFVIPLGATVNMDGTALYECVAAMFIAQAYGIELGFGTQMLVVSLALLTSIGVAGIPAASLVAILIILEAIGLPAEALGLILAVDRILDMCRTSVNVFSDSCGAVIIARLEGEQPYTNVPGPASS